MVLLQAQLCKKGLPNAQDGRGKQLCPLSRVWPSKQKPPDKASVTGKAWPGQAIRVRLQSLMGAEPGLDQSCWLRFNSLSFTLLPLLSSPPSLKFKALGLNRPGGDAVQTSSCHHMPGHSHILLPGLGLTQPRLARGLFSHGSPSGLHTALRQKSSSYRSPNCLPLNFLTLSLGTHGAPLFPSSGTEPVRWQWYRQP